jgi:hypothetical protein
MAYIEMQVIFIKTELLDNRKRGRCRRVKETTTIEKGLIDEGRDGSEG